jgi:hypothetical protein
MYGLLLIIAIQVHSSLVQPLIFTNQHVTGMIVSREATCDPNLLNRTVYRLSLVLV